MREEEIEKLRGVIRDCVSKHLYSSAIFFADKVAAVTGEPADVYMQAQALYLGRHHRRAFHLLNASQIEELKEWDQCLLMLGDAKVDEHGNVSDTKACNTMYLAKEGEDRDMNITSAICFLRGKAYEALENRAQARQWYKAAIKADPLCYEALECLLEKHMLTSEEGQNSLLSSLLTFYADGPMHEAQYDKESIVEAKFRELEREDSNIKPSEQSFVCTLKNNTDLLACKAEYYHQCGEYQKCFELTSIKATSLDGTFPPAWIGYGNAYAAQEEGDQAMSAYRTAARLFPGCHLPTLYIGMEYMRSHSFKLADQAKAICSTDPLVYNELGVVAYHMKEYKKAVWWFENTLAHVPSSSSEMWEPTVVNLAHALRKLKRYREAITYYEKALALSSRSLSTYAGLAYTYHLQALWLKPDDQFCTEMLTLALVDESRCGVPNVEPRRSKLFI
ncbi:hypothetical protein RJ640_004328 [Escallonia rubra]|uniref:Anaphase-promoting complex subunit 6 n=1 Tax=Escallonia rubra TaxID=112253 RepID=A0AA88RAY4_9ASTE|nr:hypothetical protein RJ640_004328 [Escallonia rubra]